MSNHISEERRHQIVSLLVEGNSCRSIQRLTGSQLRTILRQLVIVGNGCQRLLHQKMRNLKLRHVQADEIWTFCKKKQGKLTPAERKISIIGDQYLFVAFDTDTKLVIAYALGKRTKETTDKFLTDLHRRMIRPPLGFLGDKPQLSTDAFHAYEDSVDTIFADTVNYGQIVKIYEHSQWGRYAPPGISEANRRNVKGIENLESICTSHVERNNLTIRTFIRRFTRLSLGFSKKIDNLWASISLHFAHYNFCRIHSTLKTTPAVAAGVVDEPWSLQKLLDRI